MTYTYAPYATNPANSKGRLHPDSQTIVRSPFQRDRDRILHSNAFRRLEFKTQVFTSIQGDLYRNRLTHTLEVAQVSRTMALALGLDEALAEAIALAHDLGHPPFGHAGEDALAAKMEPFGGFNHNIQTLHLVTCLEERYINFDGLNLSWETLDGIIKHNGPLTGPNALPRYAAIAKHPRIINLENLHKFNLSTYSSLEAQVASFADDIAYLAHDLQDGERAQFYSVDGLLELPLISDFLKKIMQEYPSAPWRRQFYQAISSFIHHLIHDVLATTRANMAQYGIQTADDVRNCPVAIVQFSKDYQTAILAIRKFLTDHVYRHYRVNRMTNRARGVLAQLFDTYFANPECLPTEWQKPEIANSEQAKAQVICDFIAGMTDRYALKEFGEFFGSKVFV